MTCKHIGIFGTHILRLGRRIPPTVPPEEMERIIHTFIDPENIDIEFVEKVPEHNVSDISGKNPWWTEFRQSFEELKMKVEPEVPN